MPKFLKITLISIATIIVLLILFSIILVNIINPNQFKPLIVKKTYQATGRRLAIKGAIKLSFFPWLGLKIDNVQLGNTSAFTVKQFVDVKELDVTVKLLPLLSGDVEIGKVTLNGATIHLIKQNNGLGNWQQLEKKYGVSYSAKAAKEYQQVTGKKTSSPVQKVEGSNFELGKIFVSNLAIRNSQLIWNDQKSRQTTRINNINLSAKNIQFGKAFPFDLSLRLKQKQQNIALKLSSELALTQDLNSINLEKLDLSGNIKQVHKSTPFALRGKLNISKQQNIRLNLNSMQFAKLSGNGSVSIQNIVSAPKATLDMTINSLNLNHFIPSSAKATAAKGKKSSAVHIKKIRKTPAKKATGWSRTPILPVTLLSQWQVNGKLQIKTFIYKTLKLHNIVLPIKSKRSGSFTLGPVLAKLNPGSVNTSISLNANAKTPTIAMNFVSKSVNLPSVIKLFSSHDFIHGLGNFNTKVSTSGNSLYSWIHSLSGTGSMNVAKGSLRGVDVNYYLNIGRALLAKRHAPKQTDTHNTAFQHLRGSYTITRGVLSNRDLLFKSGDVQVHGSGTVNLAQQNLNYAIDLPLSKTLIIPIQIKGALSSPSIQLNTQKLIQAQAQQALKQAQKRLQKQAQQHIKKSLNDVLKKNNISIKGLLGG